jgi:hypothetical protein
VGELDVIFKINPALAHINVRQIAHEALRVGAGGLAELGFGIIPETF